VIKILLDTNAYSNLHKGDEFVRKEVEKADRVYLSTVTLGELYLGFKLGSKESLNLKFLQGFLSLPEVSIVDVTKDTAEIYGKVGYGIREQGTPIPMNDIWIACCAIETDSTLITYDEHFLKIKGLKIWNRLS